MTKDKTGAGGALRRWLAVGVSCAIVLWWLAPSAKPRSKVRAPLSDVNISVDQHSTPNLLPPLEEARSSTALSGRVQTTSGRMIAGAVVCGMDETSACCDVEHCGVSDSNGEFTLSRSTVAMRALLASAVGFRPKKLAVVNPSGERLLITLEASGGSTVSGHVVDANGGPVARALVTARTDTDEESIVVALSDAAGAFQIEIAAEYADLTAQAEAYSLATRSVQVPSVGVNIVLALGAVVCGRVTERGTKHGIAATTVHAQNTNGLRVEPLRVGTDYQGTFCIEALTPGGYELWVAGNGWRSERGWRVVAVGEHARGVTLEAEHAGTLEGIIRASGEPCPDGSAKLDGPGEATFFEQAHNGRVIFEGLPLGPYTANVYCDAAAPLREELEIGVERATRAWNLDAGFELRGRVRKANGEPLAAMGVFVSPSDTLTAWGAPPLRTVSNERGEFHVGGLLAGEYTLSMDGFAQWAAPPHQVRVRQHTTPVELFANAEGSIRAEVSTMANAASLFVRHEKMNFAFPGERRGNMFVFEHLPMGRYAVTSGDGEALEQSTHWIELRSDGEIARVTLRGIKNIHTISGRVVDESGVPVLDAWVTARTAEAMPFSMQGDIEPALTNEQGEFTLGGLQIGKYRIEVSSGEGQAIAYDVATDAQIAVVVPRFGGLFGDVYSPDGEPARGATLTILHQSGTQHVLSVSEGAWVLPWAAPGLYDLSAVSAEGHATITGVVLESGCEQRLTLDLHPD